MLLAGLSDHEPAQENIYNVQSGANEGETLTADLGLMSVNRLGLGAIDVSTRESAIQGVEILDKALEAVSAQRAATGAKISSMDHRINYLENSAVIMEEARSRVMDADIPAEMMIYAKLTMANQISNLMLKQVAIIQKRTLDLFL
jgi:flagellin